MSLHKLFKWMIRFEESLEGSWCYQASRFGNVMLHTDFNLRWVNSYLFWDPWQSSVSPGKLWGWSFQEATAVSFQIVLIWCHISSAVGTEVLNNLRMFWQGEWSHMMWKHGERMSRLPFNDCVTVRITTRFNIVITSNFFTLTKFWYRRWWGLRLLWDRQHWKLPHYTTRST